MLLSARKPPEPEHEARGGRPFLQGFVSNALNPKVALFFLTFVPQFLPDRGSTLPVALALSATFAAIYLAWFTGLVRLVGLASDALRRPARQGLDRAGHRRGARRLRRPPHRRRAPLRPHSYALAGLSPESGTSSAAR